MAKYKDKWKTTFPTSIGNQTRPEDGVDNTQEYNTDGLPQYMANDPVRYDLQNAVNSQLVSNDERLNEKIKRTSDDLAAHNKDPKAHATGISGNAATASKLLTPRTISLTGKAAGSASFDGSANAAINVTSVNADTASKLSTARKINITGNASGSAAFDGTSDVSINVSVSQAAHADKATQDTNGRAFTDTNAYMHISALADNTDFNNVKTTGIYYCTGNTYLNRPHNSWGILTVYSIGTVKQEYRPNNAAVYYTREYDNTNWNAWSKVNAANADTATKLATARTISLTGNAAGSATFDGSGNISISTTVNESKHATAADMATNDSNGDKIDDTYLKKATVIDVIYPVGSIYMSMSATNPTDLFGVGTWERISQGRMLLGADDSTYKAGATGGEATHTLTAEEMPAHSHSGTTSTNGNHSHGVRDADYHDGYGNSFDSGDWGPRRYIQTTDAGNHNHTFTTDNSGGGAAHNNMSPYLVCYIWQRTA